MAPINITPIGIVHSEFVDSHELKVSSHQSTIEIFSPYLDALWRLEEHSHIWAVGWFHQASRDLLRVTPRVNTDLPEYGVFGLRSPVRPNPIGLSAVRLLNINNNILTVQGLDFVDGTPIIDIKPYYEQDIIFSPVTPYIKPKEPELLEAVLFKEALKHHQEECNQLYLGVKMCLAAERLFGRLTAPDLKVTVCGTGCLADTIQGITRARVANPDRFSFVESLSRTESRWERSSQSAIITLKNNREGQLVQDQPFESLFDIKVLTKESQLPYVRIFKRRNQGQPSLF